MAQAPLTYPPDPVTVDRMKHKKQEVDVSKLDRSAVAKFFSKMGASKGGKASAAALTPEQRKAKGKKAIAARWGKVKRPKGELPVDQRQVMRRLEGKDEVVLAIAPGAGGKRRRATIGRLAEKGLVVVLKEKTGEVTIKRGGECATQATEQG